MIGLVGFPQQEGGRSVGGEAQFGKEVGVAGGDQGIGGDPSGGPMVGMEPVAAPGIVPQHNRRLYGPDGPGHLPSLVGAVLELTVAPAEEDQPVGRERVIRCQAVDGPG